MRYIQKENAHFRFNVSRNGNRTTFCSHQTRSLGSKIHQRWACGRRSIANVSLVYLELRERVWWLQMFLAGGELTTLPKIPRWIWWVTSRRGKDRWKGRKWVEGTGEPPHLPPWNNLWLRPYDWTTSELRCWRADAETDSFHVTSHRMLHGDQCNIEICLTGSSKCRTKASDQYYSSLS